MDTNLLGTLIAIVKSIPGTAANRAEAAQAAAESAAETAQHYGYGMYVENHIKTITSEEESE